MNESTGNDLCNEIIAQSISKMKETQGESFSLKDVNLAELERQTGISRGKLRRLKKNGFVMLPHGRTGQKSSHTVLSGFTSVLDNLLRLGITNSVVCFERLTESGYTGSLSTVKRYISSHQDGLRKGLLRLPDPDPGAPGPGAPPGEHDDGAGPETVQRLSAAGVPEPGIVPHRT